MLLDCENVSMRYEVWDMNWFCSWKQYQNLKNEMLPRSTPKANSCSRTLKRCTYYHPEAKFCLDFWSVDQNAPKATLIGWNFLFVDQHIQNCKIKFWGIQKFEKLEIIVCMPSGPFTIWIFGLGIWNQKALIIKSSIQNIWLLVCPSRSTFQHIKVVWVESSKYFDLEN